LPSLCSTMPLDVPLHSATKSRVPNASFIAIFPFGLCLQMAVPSIMLGAYLPDLVQPQKEAKKPPK
ncbi:hypothetical protein, partial [Pseudomonas shahriarae]|uniref:hypothetical protein n=1 Tax=Pseudomonas shahriarae TaxID=2745512 RepID=UPI00249A536A